MKAPFRPWRRDWTATDAEYVYFAAADDWVIPGFFDAAITALEAHPELGLFCGEALLVDAGSGEVTGLRPAVRPRHSAGPISADATRKLLAQSDNWILTGSAVFRRDAVLEAGGFNPELGSFADGFMTRKVALTKGFYFSPRQVSAWTISAGSLSVRTALEWGGYDLALRVAEHIANDPAFPDWYAATFRKRYIFGSLRVSLMMAGSEDKLRENLYLMGDSPVDRALTDLMVQIPQEPIVADGAACLALASLSAVPPVGAATDPSRAVAARLAAARDPQEAGGRVGEMSRTIGRQP